MDEHRIVARLLAGRAFNRGFPNLAPAVAKKTGEKLGPDSDENIAIIRKAMGKALRRLTPVTPVEILRHHLMSLAYDADVVLYPFSRGP